MQMIGKMGSAGFTHSELLAAQAWFTSKGIETTVYELDGRSTAVASSAAVGGGAATAVTTPFAPSRSAISRVMGPVGLSG